MKNSAGCSFFTAAVFSVAGGSMLTLGIQSVDWYAVCVSIAVIATGLLLPWNGAAIIKNEMLQERLDAALQKK